MVANDHVRRHSREAGTQCRSMQRHWIPARGDDDRDCAPIRSIMPEASHRILRTMTARELEPGIVTDLTDRLTYGGYLRLDRMLAAQEPLSGADGGAPRHDEMLFIIQHQVSELWMKLMIHELKAAIAHVQRGRARAVLQDPRARQADPEAAVRAVGGAGDADAVGVRGVPSGARQLVGLPVGAVPRDRVPARQQAPGHARRVPARSRRSTPRSTRCCTRRRSTTSSCGISRGAACRCPPSCVERDFTQPYVRHPGVVAVFKTIYDDPKRWWDAYDMCEKLVDVEEAFQLWRFRHMKTVERIIGHKRGTGGSSGVAFLRAGARALVLPRADRRAHRDRRALARPSPVEHAGQAAWQRAASNTRSGSSRSTDGSRSSAKYRRASRENGSRRARVEEVDVVRAVPLRGVANRSRSWRERSVSHQERGAKNIGTRPMFGLVVQITQSERCRASASSCRSVRAASRTACA